MSLNCSENNIAYIHREECIRLSCATDDADPTGFSASIVGVGAHNDQPSFTPRSQILMGEIEEIMILDANMDTVAVHNKSSHSRYSVQKSSEQKREQFIKRRNDLQKKHDVQTETLLKKHEEEKHQIENHPNFTDDEMEYILMNAVEPMHQKQLRIMKERHQKEQELLMDLMFKSAFDDEGGGRKNLHRAEKEKSHDNKRYDKKDPSEHMSAHSSYTSEQLGTIDESYATSSVGTSSVDESSVETGSNTRVSENLDQNPNQPIYRAIQQAQLNDPTFQVIDLDGQDEVPKKLWRKLFETIENNKHVNKISLQDCGLSDEKLVPLLISLVENNTILAMNLSVNPNLTDKTGELLLKVLCGGNDKIFDIDLNGTSISSHITADIEDILVKRINVNDV